MNGKQTDFRKTLWTPRQLYTHYRAEMWLGIERVQDLVDEDLGMEKLAQEINTIHLYQTLMEYWGERCGEETGV